MQSDLADARIELSRFLRLSVELNSDLTMFSDRIDLAWHELLEDKAVYDTFCHQACGRSIGHRPSGDAPGRPVEVEWIGEYEARFGPLPALWFADEHGHVDEKAYREYLDSRSVVASWKCSPTTNCNSDTGDQDRPRSRANAG